MTNPSVPPIGVIEHPALAAALTRIGLTVIGGGAFQEAARDIRSLPVAIPVVIADVQRPGLRGWAQEQAARAQLVILDREGAVPGEVGIHLREPAPLGHILQALGFGQSVAQFTELITQNDANARPSGIGGGAAENAAYMGPLPLGTEVPRGAHQSPHPTHTPEETRQPMSEYDTTPGQAGFPFQPHQDQVPQPVPTQQHANFGQQPGVPQFGQQPGVPGFPQFGQEQPVAPQFAQQAQHYVDPAQQVQDTQFGQVQQPQFAQPAAPQFPQDAFPAVPQVQQPQAFPAAPTFESDPFAQQQQQQAPQAPAPVFPQQGDPFAGQQTSQDPFAQQGVPQPQSPAFPPAQQAPQAFPGYGQDPFAGQQTAQDPFAQQQQPPQAPALVFPQQGDPFQRQPQVAQQDPFAQQAPALQQADPFAQEAPVEQYQQQAPAYTTEPSVPGYTSPEQAFPASPDLGAAFPPALQPEPAVQEQYGVPAPTFQAQEAPVAAPSLADFGLPGFGTGSAFGAAASTTAGFPEIPDVRDDQLRAQVIVSYGGKGGVGKTTCAVLMAQRAAASGMRVVVVDMNRGQGNIRSYLRLDNPNLPTVYNAAVTGKAQDALISPKVLKENRDSSLPSLGFAVVMSPPHSLADPKIVTAAVYSKVIRFIQTQADLVILDTQIVEAKDTSGLIDNVMVPLLLRGAWGLGVADMSRPGREDLLKRTQGFINEGVKRDRLLLMVNKAQSFGNAEQQQINEAFSGLSAFLGAAGEDPELASAMNSGSFDVQNSTLRPILDAALYQATGSDKFLPETQGPKRRGIFGRRR